MLQNPGVCFCLRSPKRRRQPRHRRKGLVKLFKISTSNRQYTVRWLVGVGDLINYLNAPMALVGVGDLIVLGEILVEVGDLINCTGFAYICGFGNS